MLALVINTVLNILLLKPLGVKGLALATTLSGTITLLLLAWSLRRKIGRLGLRRLIISLVKMTVATVLMAAAVRPVYDLLFGATESLLLSFCVAVAAGGLIYVAANILLRTQEMGVVIVTVGERALALVHRKDA